LLIILGTHLRLTLHRSLSHPNFLQNVFGEGALSASFIPVYANLLARKDEREAGRVAGAGLRCWHW